MARKDIQGFVETRVFYEDLLSVLSMVAKSEETMKFGAGITRLVKKIGSQKKHGLLGMGYSRSGGSNR